MSDECGICCEKFNKTRRKEIICILCEEPKPKCCFDCFKKFLLTKTEPSCIFCKQELTMDFVYENSTRTFIDEYNNFRFETRFSVEMSRLPETQEQANQVKWVRKRERDLKRLYNERVIINAMKRLVTDDLPFAEKEKNQKDIENLKEQKIKLTEEANQKYAEYFGIVNARYTKHDKTKERFIKACPGDNCRGFLSTAYKCGTCEKYFCPDCNEMKAARNDEQHVCNEEVKATMDLIKSDSKPCPKCATLIFKISGCPQMWCVQCHTAFNWNTGLIDNGHIHNPEYFRYLRENGQHIPRNPNDIVNGCNVRLPTLTELRINLKDIPVNVWNGWFDYTHHVRWYVLPNDAQNFRNIDYSSYRIQYLNEEITLENWKKTLKMKMKKDELHMERFLILDMYCNVMTDIFNNLIVEKNGDVFKINAVNIFNYTNAQMQKLNSKFASQQTRYFLNKADNRIRHYFQ